ncbi:MAG: hypothetical protein Kow0090_11240 [Myxococcota bacterium]
MYGEKVKPLGLMGVLAGVLLLAIFFALDTQPVHRFIHNTVSETISEVARLKFSAESFEVDASRLSVSFLNPSLHAGDGTPIFSARSLRASLDPFPLLWGDIYFERVVLKDAELNISIKNGEIEGVYERTDSGGNARKEKTSLYIGALEISNSAINLSIDDDKKIFAANIQIQGFINTDGATHVEAVSTGGQIKIGETTRPLDKLALNFDYEDNWVTVNSLLFRSNQTMLDLSGKITDDLVKGDKLSFSFKTPLDLLNFAVKDSLGAGGSIEITGELSDWLKYPRGEAQVKLSAGRIGEFFIGDLELSASTLGNDKIYLNRLKILNAEGEIDAKGILTRDENLSFSAEGTTKKIHFGKLLENLTVERSRADFYADMEFKAAGNILNELNIEGDVKVELSKFRAIERPYNATAGQFNIITLDNGGTVSSHFVIDKSGFYWNPAYARFGRNTVKVTGALYFTNEDGLLLVCESDSNFYLDDVRSIAGFPVSGKGKVIAIIRGPYPDPSISGSFDLKEATFAGYSLGNVGGRVYFKDEQLYFPFISGSYKSTEYNGFFEIDFADKTNILTSAEVTKGRLEDVLEALRIKDRLPDMRGDVSSAKTEFKFKAGKELLNGYLRANLGEGRLAGQKFQTGELDARIENNHLFVEKVALARRGGKLTLAGEISAERKLNLALKSWGLNANQFSLFEENKIPLSAGLDLTLFISGSLEKPQLNGHLKFTDIRYSKTAFPPSAITAVSDETAIRITGNFYDSQLTLGANISLEQHKPFRAWAQLNNLGLHTYFLPELTEKGEAKSALNGAAVFSGELTDFDTVSGAIKIDKATAQLGPLKTSAPEPLEFRFKNKRLYFDKVSLAGSDLSLVMKGSLPLEKEEAITLSARGNMKLGWIKQLGIEYFTLNGDTTFEASIGGVLADPTVLGNALLKQGVLTIPEINLTVSELNGKTIFSQNKLILDGIKGSVGGGKVQFSGHIPLIHFFPKDIRIIADMEKTPTDVIAEIPAVINGRVMLAGTSEDRFKLNGEITVEEASYRRDFDINRLAIKRSPAEMSSAGSDDAIDLELSIFIPNSLKIENNILTAPLSGRLTVTGTSVKPTIVGTLTANEGSLLFRQTEFALQHLELLFDKTSHIAPKLDMQAFTDINEHRIFIHVYGELENPQIEYSSPQGLSNQDINHLIMFGITPKEAENIDDMALSQTLGFEILATIAGVDRVVRRLKLESFTVSSRYSDISKTTEPYLNMVVKPSKDLRFIYSSSLYNVDDRKAELRLKLGEITSLSGEYVNQSELADTPNLGLDLKFRWEF